jgi:hypothetical protein
VEEIHARDEAQPAPILRAPILLHHAPGEREREPRGGLLSAVG